MVFEVSQKFREPQPEDEDELVEQLQGQEQPINPGEEGSDATNEEKTKGRIHQLLSARASTSKQSILRHLAHLNLDYINWPTVEIKVSESGEETEIKKDAEQAFSESINRKLEHYGALYIKYMRFREKVQLMPLAPDHDVMKTMLDLQNESDDYKQWLSNVENIIASLDQQLQSHVDPTTTEVIVLQKKEAEDEKVSKAMDEEERKKIIHDCKDKLKESMDDKFFIPNYDISSYKASTLPHKEGQNSIANIMSAMVSQIAVENSYQEVYDSHLEKSKQADLEKSQSTADETIDDLFESFNAEVNYDLQIWNRPNYSETDTSSQADDVNMAMAPSIKDRKLGA